MLFQDSDDKLLEEGGVILRILLIEDEFSLADALRASLKKENYIVDLVRDGEEGLMQALTGIYDVIILDIMLPKINGFEVLKKVRKNNIKTPILILTAKSELDDKITGLDGGADDYLTKPFQTRELLARIRAILRRKSNIEEYELNFKDIVLDIKKCELKNSFTGEKIKLAAKEFQLIEYLLNNRNQVITREQIVEKIWGFDSDAEYNNVEVYISFIRKKIIFIGSEVKIKAIRGVGYTLEE